MVEVGGVERTRVDKERALKFCFALQLFITLSTASPPCFLTSLELVQGPVGQGRAELHACENWSGEQGGLNWSCGNVQKREESRWANALLFVSRRRRCRRAKKWSRQKFLTAKTEKQKNKKKRLRDCFPLALPLRFVSALLRAPLLPFFEAEHLVTRGTSSECAPPHHRRPVDRRSSPLKIGRIKIQTRSPAFSRKLENDLLLLLQDPRGERGHGRAQE